MICPRCEMDSEELFNYYDGQQVCVYCLWDLEDSVLNEEEVEKWRDKEGGDLK